MESINLISRSSSLSDIYRSLPSESLSSAAKNMHRQAAFALNVRRVDSPNRRNPNFLQRLRPSPAQLEEIGSIIKNSAIGVAGVGGVISVVNAVSKDDDKKEVNDDENDKYAASNTLIPSFNNTEYYNILGKDKRRNVTMFVCVQCNISTNTPLTILPINTSVETTKNTSKTEIYSVETSTNINPDSLPDVSFTVRKTTAARAMKTTISPN